MNAIRIISSAAISVALLLVTINGWAATDKLICKTVDGGRFVMKSKYKANVLGHVIPHVQKEYDRSPYWEGDFIDYKGKVHESDQKMAAEYGNTELYALERACSDLAFVEGMPTGTLGIFIYKGKMRSRYQYFPNNPFQNFRTELIEKRLTPLATLVREAGYITTWADLTARVGPRWVIEYTLHKREAGGAHPSSPMVAAIFQSTSDDDGQTWSEPVITQQGLIFDVGYPLYDSCVLARPYSLNGKKLDYPFAERCLAKLQK